jgi:DNA-binding response OmpR family regulator
MSGRAEASGPPARLLLADSDPSLRTVLHLALQAHGYQVALADAPTPCWRWPATSIPT